MQPWSFPGPSERDVKYDTNEILCVPSAAVDTNFPSLSCWAGFDFVCLPLGPQPPLSSQLCVPQGWPLAISWFSCPCDPASDRKPLKGLIGFMHWGNTAHHEGHGLAVYIIGAVRRQKRPPVERGWPRTHPGPPLKGSTTSQNGWKPKQGPSIPMQTSMKNISHQYASNDITLWGSVH